VTDKALEYLKKQIPREYELEDFSAYNTLRDMLSAVYGLRMTIAETIVEDGFQTIPETRIPKYKTLVTVSLTEVKNG
jgi:hypothetical protein